MADDKNDPYANNPDAEWAQTVAMQSIPGPDPGGNGGGSGGGGGGGDAGRGGGGGKTWIFVVLIVLVLAGGAVGAFFFLGGDDAKESADESADAEGEEAEADDEAESDDGDAPPDTSAPEKAPDDAPSDTPETVKAETETEAEAEAEAETEPEAEAEPPTALAAFEAEPAEVTVDPEVDALLQGMIDECTVTEWCSFDGECADKESLKTLVEEKGRVATLPTLAARLSDPAVVPMMAAVAQDFWAGLDGDETSVEGLDPAIARRMHDALVGAEKCSASGLARVTTEVMVGLDLDAKLVASAREAETGTRSEVYTALLRVGGLNGLDSVQALLGDATLEADDRQWAAGSLAWVEMENLEEAEKTTLCDWSVTQLQAEEAEVVDALLRVPVACGGAHLDAVLTEFDRRLKDESAPTPSPFVRNVGRACDSYAKLGTDAQCETLSGLMLNAIESPRVEPKLRGDAVGYFDNLTADKSKVTPLVAGWADDELCHIRWEARGVGASLAKAGEAIDVPTPLSETLGLKAVACMVGESDALVEEDIEMMVSDGKKYLYVQEGDALSRYKFKSKAESCALEKDEKFGEGGALTVGVSRGDGQIRKNELFLSGSYESEVVDTKKGTVEVCARGQVAPWGKKKLVVINDRKIYVTDGCPGESGELGEPLFELPGLVNPSDVRVVGDVLYIGEMLPDPLPDGNTKQLAAYELEGGTEQWRAGSGCPFEDGFASFASIRGCGLGVCVGDINTKDVLAFSAEDGTYLATIDLWSDVEGYPHGGNNWAMASAGDDALFVSADEKVFVISPVAAK